MCASTPGGRLRPGNRADTGRRQPGAAELNQSRDGQHRRGHDERVDEEAARHAVDVI